jgi:TonB-linked SusC/RagA family outer membrane protein
MVLKHHIWSALLFTGVLLTGLFHSQKINAQESYILSGTVRDSIDNQTMPFVVIYEKNKDGRLVGGTQSDINGVYNIRIADGTDQVVYKMVGYTVKTVDINGRRKIDVSLLQETRDLGEVQVVARRTVKVNTGMGLQIPARDRSDASKAINMIETENMPAVSIDQMIEGKAAGLMISMNSGELGAGSSIVIRGAASLGLNSKPLFVVDDVPIATIIPSDFDPSNVQQFSELVNINPDDIESITILKDAAACALYGSEGANGVIVITTKRGDNIKPRVSVSTLLTLTLPQKPIPLLTGDQYKTIILEEYQNRYNMDPLYTPSDLFLNPGDPMYENFNNNTYWPGEVNRNGYLQQYNTSVIGGGEAAQYNISLGYRGGNNTTKGSDFAGINGRFNFDYKVSKKLRFVSDFSLGNTKTNSNYNSVGATALIKAPIMPVYFQDLSGNSLPQYFIYYNGFQGTVDNPVATADLAKYSSTDNVMVSNVTGIYKPMKGLDIKSLVSITYSSGMISKFLPHSTTGTNYSLTQNTETINTSQNSGYRNPVYSLSIYQSNLISYTFDLGTKHSLLASINTIYYSNNNRSIAISTFTSPSENMVLPSSSVRYDKLSSSDNIRRTISLLGQVFYIYNDRYSVSANLRRDGSSSFGKSQRFGYFPTVSGFWRPSSEAFIKERLPWISEMKIKGSWGISGRSPSTAILNQASYLLLSSDAPYADAQGITPDNIELANLRWEKATQTNIGMIVSVFKGSLNFEINRARTITRDMIIPVSIPGSSGYNSIYKNFGTMRSDIWEIDVSGSLDLATDLVLFSSLNVSFSKNLVQELPGHQPVFKDRVIDNGTYMTFINEGDPTGSFYGFRYLGVFPTDEDAYAKDKNNNFILDGAGNKIPMRWMTSSGDIFKGGDAIYEDLNHDGIISMSDVTYLGNANPKFYGGFSFRLTYKRNWEIFSNFIYNYGNQLINLAMMNTTSVYNLNNQSTAVMRRWRQQGDITDQPRAILGMGHNFAGSDRYIQDGSFLRCSSLRLSYNIGPKFLDRINLRTVKLTASINNVFTLTKYLGVDPSVDLKLNDPYYAGRDNSRTPIPIMYTFGANVNF